MNRMSVKSIEGTLQAITSANIRAHLAANNLRVKDAARILQISEHSAGAKCRGARAFTLTELGVLADHFKIQPSDLLQPLVSSRLATTSFNALAASDAEKNVPAVVAAGTSENQGKD